MKTITGRWNAARRRNGRLRPHFDRLECRLAMSASASALATGSSLVGGSSGPLTSTSAATPLSIVSTDPASSSSLDASPSVLTVKFNGPIDSFSVGLADFELLHVEADGTTQPLGPGEATIPETLDPTDRQIELTPSSPLISGEYRLVVLGDSTLQAVDGAPLATAGQDTVISDFTIGAQQTGISAAVDLGTPTSTDTVQNDTLNLVNDPGAVDYYKVTLAPGHHWRLGLEIVSQGGPGKVDTTLSLFDSSGKLVATDSQGTTADPGDPYLFAGLAPGVYYVGVSAKGNVPGASGAYNLSQEIIAPSDLDQSDGSFQLHVVADVADRPTQVIGLRVDHADPLSTSPTGLTLQFNGSIQLTTLTAATVPAVTLVDQNGQDWGLTPTQYNATSGQLSFLLDQALLVGQYSLELTGQGGLVDLAGMTPVAAGLPAGVLGTFTVAPTTATPGDLGPILPAVAASGLAANLTVAPLSTLTEHFTIVVPGIYSLTGLGATPGVTSSLAGAGSKALTTGANATAQGSDYVSLSAGSYTLTLTNAGTSAAQVPITINGRGVEFSQILEGGVGQGPAFSLRLVAPQADFGQPIVGPVAATAAGSASATAPGVDLSTPAASTAAGASATDGPAREAMSVPTPATPAGPSSALLSYSPAPVGRPSAAFNQISAVGPGGPSGSVALASNSGGMPPGLVSVPVAISPVGDPEPEANPMEPGAQVDDVTSPQRGSTLESGLLARSPGSRREDEIWLARAEWFGKVASAAAGWLGRGEVAEPAAPVVAATTPGPAPTGPAMVAEETYVETAAVASPIGIGALAVFAYHYLRRRVDKRGKPGTGRLKAKGRSILTGPHRRVESLSRR